MRHAYHPNVVFSLLLGAALLHAEEVGKPLSPLLVEGQIEANLMDNTTKTNSAMFGSTSLLETPFSVSSYGQEIIQSQRAFSTAEILKNDPSVYSGYGGGEYGYYDSFGIRGFYGSNNQSYRVDGVSFSNQGEVPIDNKERLDVLKGPGAMRFGFMPPGGALNFVRKRPLENQRTSITTDADTHGGLYGQIDHSWRFGDRNQVGARVVLAYENIDSFWRGADGDRTFGSFITEWKASDDLKITFSAEADQRSALPGSGVLISETGRIFETGAKTNYTSDWSYYDTEIFNLQLGAEYRINPDWSMEATVAHNAFTRDNSQSYVDMVRDDGTFDVYDYTSPDEERPHTTLEWMLHGTFGSDMFRHELSAGMSYRDHEMTYGDGVYSLIGVGNVFDPRPVPFAPSGLNVPPSYRAYEEEELGMFVSDTLHIGEQWSVLGALRHVFFESNSYNSTGTVTQNYDETALSPTAALMFEPVEKSQLYVMTTQGLQPGGIAPMGTVNANDVMAPIESKQFEAGYKWNHESGLFSGEIAAFRIEKDLEFTNAANRYVQSGTQTHDGIEVSLRGRPVRELEAGLSVALLDAVQEETGDPLVNGRRPEGASEYHLTSYLDWQTPVEGLALTAYGYWVGDRYADNTEAVLLDGYFRMDMGARYKFRAADIDWTARLNVENILNTEYYASGYWFSGWGGRAYHGSPIAARISLTGEF